MNGSIFLVFGVLVLSLFSVPLSISADANYQENQIPIKPKIGEIRTLPLVKPDISFDRASYEPDQTVTVTVNDRYANKDPNAVDKISTVTVTGAATGQSSSFVISETGVNTGIFDRELGVAKFWAPNPPDTIKATYTYNHGDTNSGTVSVTAKVVAPAPTDTDRDGVPDEKDNCPKEAGPANNKGCPVKIERIPTPVPVPPRPVPVEPKDSDGDGVPDNEDACPREYGPANNRGCPAKEPVPAPTRDDTPPFLIVPSDIVTDATTTQGVKVAYIVTAIDDVDGELKPTCSKSSGSLFAIGTTRVDCQVTDSAGNTAKKSFNVTVKSIMPAKPILKIPSYVKNLATFWQQDQIDDDSFTGAIKYMIENKIISIPQLPVTQKAQPPQKIPGWVKTSTQFWIDGQTSDKEYATSLEWLVKEGIIIIDQPPPDIVDKSKFGIISPSEDRVIEREGGPSTTGGLPATHVPETQSTQIMRDELIACEGVPVQVQIRYNGIDPDSNPIIFANPDTNVYFDEYGMWYTPPVNFAGIDSFTYTVDDGANTASTMVEVTVYSNEELVLSESNPQITIAECIFAEVIARPLWIPASASAPLSPGYTSGYFEWTGFPHAIASSTSIVIVNYTEMQPFVIELTGWDYPNYSTPILFYSHGGYGVCCSQNSNVTISPKAPPPASMWSPWMQEMLQYGAIHISDPIQIIDRMPPYPPSITNRYSGVNEFSLRLLPAP